MSEQGQVLIARWQPYLLGDGAAAHPLAMLQRLSNRDKHVTLLPAAVVQRREPVLVGFGEWKVEEIHYFNPSPTQLLKGTEVVVFVTSGEPSDKFVVDPLLTWKLVIEDRSIVDFEAMIDYVGNEILGSFDRDWD